MGAGRVLVWLFGKKDRPSPSRHFYSALYLGNFSSIGGRLFGIKKDSKKPGLGFYPNFFRKGKNRFRFSGGEWFVGRLRFARKGKW